MPEWLIPSGLFVLGLFLIVKGGDFFVDAASWMAVKTGIPKFIIGATVVSLATTLPEILVSLIAASQGKADIAVGNAIGSVTVNIGLIMGLSLICIPHVIRRRDYAMRSALMLGAALIVMLFGLGGAIGPVPSLLLLVVFALSMYDNIAGARAHRAANRTEETDAPVSTGSTPLNLLKFFLGAAGIVLGAQLLVENGSTLAGLLGVPERVIAVTVIAIGTSLPELVTTVTAIAKKEHSLSIGNIIGANIINLTLILPLCALISGQALPISSQSAQVDIPVCLGIACIAILPTLITKRFSRVQGLTLVAVYAGYVVYVVM